MNLSSQSRDLDVLKSGVTSVIEAFTSSQAAVEAEPGSSGHAPHAVPQPPKLYETSEDMQRLKDWAVSVAQQGVTSRDAMIEVCAVTLPQMNNYLFVCLFVVCLSVCLSVCLFVCLFLFRACSLSWLQCEGSSLGCRSVSVRWARKPRLIQPLTGCSRTN